MKQNLHNIFNSGACPGADDLQLYLSGSMSLEDANHIEQHIESCELCKDALEGLEALADTDKLNSITSELNSKVDNLLEQKASKKLFSAWYKVAAAIAILVLAGGILFINNQFRDNQQIFTEHYKPFEKEEKPLIEKEKVMEQELPDEDIIENSTVAAAPETKSIDLNENTSDLLVEDDEMEIEQPLAPTPEAVKEIEEQAVFADEDLEIAADKYSAVDARATSEENKLMQNEVVVAQDELKDVVEIQEITTRKLSKNKKMESAKAPAVTQGRSINRDAAVSTGVPNVSSDTRVIAQHYYAKGEEQYEQSNFMQAKLWYAKALDYNKKHYEANFYSGLCALQLNEEKECIEFLEKVIIDEKGKHYEPALWYISLAQVKNENTRKAKKYLKKIILLKGEYQSKAEKLLEEL